MKAKKNMWLIMGEEKRDFKNAFLLYFCYILINSGFNL